MPLITQTDFITTLAGVAAGFTCVGAGLGYFVHELTHRASYERESQWRHDRELHEAHTIHTINTGGHRRVPWPDGGNRHGNAPQPVYAPAVVPVPQGPVTFIDSDITTPPRHAPVSPSPLVADYASKLGWTPATYDWASRTAHTALDIPTVTD